MISWCDVSDSHPGPYFTVTILAVEGGPGTRIGDHTGSKRRVGRLRLRRLCKDCLVEKEFRVFGQELLGSMGKDPAAD